MANPPKPWKSEYAKSSRSSCKTCKSPIEKEILRLGKMVQATQFDGFMPMWHHASCILRKANQIKNVDDVEGLELLRWEDQQKIRKYVEAGGSTQGPTNASTPSVTECGIETSQTSRASCRKCSEKIMKGEVRVSFKPDKQNARSLAWHHVKCFTEMYPTVEVDKVSGWNSLLAADQAAVLALVKPASSTAKGKKTEPVEEPLEGSNAVAKRKRNSGNNGKSKVAKTEEDSLPDQMEEPSKGRDLESQLEAQSRTLWALKDDLKKHVSNVELHQMLEINSQDSTGSELDLRERCADGMLFGPLAACPLCKGFLRYSSSTYKCNGYLTEWSKCSYSTTEPERVKGKWNIPEETDNKYLLKWYNSQKLKKPSRLMPQPTPTALNRCQSSNAMTKGSKSEDLKDLKVSITGSSKDSVDEWKNKIEAVGVQVHKKIKKDTNCLVVLEGLDDNDAETRKARKMKLPILRVDYLEECIKRGKSLPFDLYKIETVENRKSVVTVKVKGRSAVHEASGLQDSGHILEDGKSIYNTTLSMSDLSTGVNSYYILQIIQEDKGSDCYVFRKWGRVGNEKIGGAKLDGMNKSDAINEFKRLFLEKTGNTWAPWESKTFQKQPGRFYPLDIDFYSSSSSSSLQRTCLSLEMVRKEVQKRHGKQIAKEPRKKKKVVDPSLVNPNQGIRIGDRHNPPRAAQDQSRVPLRDESESGSDTDDDVPLVRLPRVGRGGEASRSQPEEATERREPVRQNVRPPIHIPLARRFINPKAFEVYNKHYLTRTMLIERAVLELKVDPAFVKLLTDKKWDALKRTPKTPVNATLVREFYANCSETNLETGVVMVRGVKVPFTPKVINEKYQLAPFEGLDYKEAIKAKQDAREDPLEDLRLLVCPEVPWTLRPGGDRKELVTTSWTEDWKVQCRFIQNRLLPKNNLTHFHIGDLRMLYALNFKLNVDVGQAIFDEIAMNQKTYARCLICPHLIHSLCIDAGVTEYEMDHKPKNPRYLQREKVKFTGQSEEEAAHEPGSSSAPPPVSSLPTLSPSVRMRLSMAHSLRNWMEDIRTSQNNILSILRCMSEDRPPRDRGVFNPSTIDNVYSDEIEQAIADVIQGGSSSDDEEQTDTAERATTQTRPSTTPTDGAPPVGDSSAPGQP